MKITISISLAALLLAIGTAPALSADSAQLGSAKELYAQASYEDALVQLNAIKDVDVANQVDQYKALCLLALGRDREAQASLERLVVRAPLYTVKVDDAPPKLVTMFQQVRARALPTAAKDLYSKAKANFDGRHFTEAQAEFEEMLAIVQEAAADDPKSPVADLRQLGEGFLKLTNAELTAAAAAVAPAQVALRPATPKVLIVYSPDDADVVPPTEIVRDMPAWNPPWTEKRKYTGMLRVDIDENGRVERTAIVQPILPAYDSRLLAAAKTWRFQPATKDGVPVKYRKTISVALQPPNEP
jgi:TonB family protein